MEAMIDLETLSIQRNACILTIGCIKFNRFQKEILPLDKLEKFYVRIDLKSCEELGFVKDTYTEMWWNNQCEEAKYEAFTNPDRIHIKDALIQLKIFLQPCKYIWSQGTFDTLILDEAYKKCNIVTPWKYWNCRDCRTVFDVLNFNYFDFKQINSSSITYHNALEDCYSQILGLWHALREK